MWKAFLDAYREYLIGKYFGSKPSDAMGERLKEFQTRDFKEIV